MVAQLMLSDPECDPVAAYRKVYTKSSTKSASESVSRLQNMPEFQRYMTHLMAERDANLAKDGDDKERYHVTPERVLRELSYIGFSDIRDVAEWRGNRLQFKSSEEISLEAASAVKRVSSSFTETGQTITVDLHDKLSALKLLAEHVGLTMPMQKAIITLRQYGIFIRPREDGGYELIDAMDHGQGDLESLDFLSDLVEEDNN